MGARSLLRVAPPRGQVARDLCFDRRARRDPLRKAGTAAPARTPHKRRDPPHRPKETAQTYETARQHALDVIVGGDRTGIDATRVADCVIRVHSRSPRLRYRVGADAKWLPRLKLLPWSW